MRAADRVSKISAGAMGGDHTGPNLHLLFAQGRRCLCARPSRDARKGKPLRLAGPRRAGGRARTGGARSRDALRSKELQHFILVVTPAALESAVVRQEIRLARQEGKSVCPVKGPGVVDLNKLPRWLGHVYDLDLPEQRTALIGKLQAGRRAEARADDGAGAAGGFRRPPEGIRRAQGAPARPRRRFRRRHHRGAARRRRLWQDDARQGARPRPRHPGRLFRRNPVGRTRREARAPARDPLRPRHLALRRAAAARDDQRGRGEARRDAWATAGS